MTHFWKKHTVLRLILIALFFIAGLVMVILGWKMTGALKGLGLMCVGTLSVLLALFVYNAPFED